jgi:hypothetical protein
MGTSVSETDARATFDAPVDRGGIDVFAPLWIRQPIREGETEAVRDLLAAWADENRDGDVRTMLPVEGVSLATLFLDTGDFGWGESEGDALLWYVEVVDDDADEWDDPDATIRDASPLFDAGLGDLLAAGATVHADGRGGHRLITYATNPHRQERYAEHVGPSLVAPVAGDDLSIPVAAITVPLKPGVVSRLVSGVVAAGNWVKRFDAVSEWIRDQTDTLEEEAMYSESLLLEAVGDRLVLHYYMETEDMDRLYEAYEGTDNWDARFSDWVMRRIFEDPDAIVDPPLSSDCEVLVHAVHPARP